MKTCTTCGKEFPDDTKFCPEDGSTLRAAAGTADMIGSVIADRYHVTKKLGEGGMGAVYLGEHVKMGRKSAIKVMVQSMANDPDAVARFNREAANAARINHHNVCAIYDFGETEDGTIFLAMEFIEGEALTDLLQREGALDPKRAADILTQCTDALQAAHDLNIVHRDIKPDNIMIAKTRDGADLVKVVDFGIAKAVGGEEGQNVTKTGLVVGTPEYMSPEQLSGDVLDGRSDVYSIALVYYRMLTGTLPFQADTAQETMIKRLTDDPLSLADALPGANFPPELQAVMDRALQRIPSDRYATAHELGKAVESVSAGLSDAPAAGPDVDGATQLIDSSEITADTAPQPATTGAGDELAATRVASAEESRSATPDTPQPAAPPAAVEKKKSPMLAIAASVAVIAVGGTATVMMMNKDDSAGPQTVAITPPESLQTGDNVTPGTENGSQQTDNGNRPANDGNRPSGGDNRNPSNDTSRDNGANPANDRNNPRTTPEDTNPPTPPVTTTVDVAGLMGELDDLQNQADVSTGDELARIRGRLQEIYGMQTIPDSVKARAADLTAITYDFAGDGPSACRWYRNVITLDPSRETQLSRSMQRLGC